MIRGIDEKKQNKNEITFQFFFSWNWLRLHDRWPPLWIWLRVGYSFWFSYSFMCACSGCSMFICIFWFSFHCLRTDFILFFFRKNDKSFKVPNAINQDCFRYYCFCLRCQRWWCWSCLNAELYKHIAYIVWTIDTNKHTHTYLDRKALRWSHRTPHHIAINLQAGRTAALCQCQSGCILWPIRSMHYSLCDCVWLLDCETLSREIFLLLWVCACP